MKISIIQGYDTPLESADVNVVIDVIRAFTTAYIAFERGAKEILLTNSVEDALEQKKQNPSIFLAGEVEGIAIEGFDIDNSPYNMSKQNLEGKTLIQKTTNGVRATLNALDCSKLFVTGLSNAQTLAHYLKKQKIDKLNLIASHPSSDDDVAVAEYIASIISKNPIDVDVIKQRILNAEVTQKFFDSNNDNFHSIDITEFALQESISPFVMQVAQDATIPTIKKVLV